MDTTVLNSYEGRGLHCPFVSNKSGDVIIAQSGESIKAEISQMVTVIFETIGAIGDIKVDKIEMFGDAKGLIMELEIDRLVGSLFEFTEGLVLSDLWSLLDELKQQEGVVVEVEEKRPKVKPEEKPKEIVREKPIEKLKVKLDASILDEMKERMKEYLGDFTERIYKNQIKSQRIDVNDFYDEDARRLIFALGKAAGMIIGPSKGRKMTDKLLELLK